jgi:hypothetical protein
MRHGEKCKQLFTFLIPGALRDATRCLAIQLASCVHLRERDNGQDRNLLPQEIVAMGTSKQTKRRTIKLFTIGFTQKTAEEFFKLIKDAGVRRIVDVRLNNNGTLAGFTREAHLPYLLREIAGIGYEHIPDLAPDDEILGDWKPNKKAKEAGKKPITWAEYTTRFARLIRKRKIETLVKPTELDYACLLCSEPTPENCHRRLVAEYLRDKCSDKVKIEIVHL